MRNLEEAREAITTADRSIVSLLVPFTPAVAREETTTPKSVLSARANASGPVQLFEFIVSHINLKSLEQKHLDAILPALAGHVYDRYMAVLDVVLDKQARGITKSFDAARHQVVTDDAVKMAEEFGGDPKLIEAIYVPFTGRGVEWQDQFLRQRAGPFARTLEHTLTPA
ncbi:MAG: hypothetical protein DHS20C02_09530 [Micavibrio sp.]|nr:MAG: hypothetical protein DHS20C02_09530 [Micavibrio sp.]